MIVYLDNTCDLQAIFVHELETNPDYTIKDLVDGYEYESNTGGAAEDIQTVSFQKNISREYFIADIGSDTVEKLGKKIKK